MKQLIDEPSKMAGKTIAIAKEIFGRDLLLCFTDDTCAYMESETDYGIGVFTIYSRFPACFSPYILREHEIITEEEYEELWAEQRRKSQARIAAHEAEERRQLAALQAKYGGGQAT